MILANKQGVVVFSFDLVVTVLCSFLLVMGFLCIFFKIRRHSNKKVQPAATRNTTANSNSRHHHPTIVTTNDATRRNSRSDGASIYIPVAPKVIHSTLSSNVHPNLATFFAQDPDDDDDLERHISQAVDPTIYLGQRETLIEDFDSLALTNQNIQIITSPSSPARQSLQTSVVFQRFGPNLPHPPIRAPSSTVEELPRVGGPDDPEEGNTSPVPPSLSLSSSINPPSEPHLEVPGADGAQTEWGRVARVHSAPTTSPLVERQYTNTLVEDNKGVQENEDWWQHNFTTSAYKLTRELTQEGRDSPNNSPGPISLTKKESKTPNFDQDLAKEWAKTKQFVDLVDFLREPPEDYMVLEVPAAGPPYTGHTTTTTTTTPTTNNGDESHSPNSFRLSPESHHTRGPLQPTLRRDRPSFKVDISVADRAIQEKEANAIWSDFALMLKSNTGLVQFMEFLKTNISGENILFYQAVEEIRRNPTVSLVVTTCQDFVRNDACSMVNIRGSSQSKIIGEVERVKREGRVTHEVIEYFEEAQNEIYRLMESDLFPRFISSDRCEPWKQECRKAVAELHQKQQQRPKFQLTRSVSNALLRRNRRAASSHS